MAGKRLHLMYAPSGFWTVIYSTNTLPKRSRHVQICGRTKYSMGGYFRQTFLDTARRLVREADCLLSEKPVHFFDGAVACALLASECALKALLLFGHGADEDAALPPDIQKRCFQGKQGHELKNLWENVPNRFRESIASSVRHQRAFQEALAQLDATPRYEHRYGKTRPTAEHASTLIEHAKTLCRCISEVLPS